MIRYLTLVIDFSRSSLKLDMRPNRALVTKELLNAFIQEFVDQNPLSKLSVIVTFKQRAVVISDFQDSLQFTLSQMKQIDDFEGSPSFQNCLEIALKQFDVSVPLYAHKEVLIINSSITNCDPDDIHVTMEKLKDHNIVCSVISLSAAIYILQQLCKQTQGQFFLAKNKDHYE